MKYFLLLACFVCLMTLPAAAQREANNWYWGHGRALQFLPTLQEIPADSIHQGEEGCVSMSERLSGKILWYSDFLSTGGDNNVNLRNGTQTIISVPPVRGYATASQGLLAVPDPADCFRYYLFSMDIKQTTAPLTEKSKLSYSVIDFRDGIGRVLSRDNVVLEDYLTEGMTGTIQSNGRDFWVVVYRFNTPTFIAISITKNGINSSNAVYSPAGVLKNDPVVMSGQLKLSPNGKKLMSNVSTLGAGLSDFDPKTGVVSNYKLFPAPISFTFSPDNSKLYTLRNVPYQGNAAIQSGRLFQIDLADPTLTPLPIDTLHTAWYPMCASLQIAPDGKIYFVSSPGNGNSPIMNLSSIELPNTKGEACKVVIEKLRLKDYNSGKESPKTQLPNYMDYIFNSSGVLGADQLTERCSLPTAFAAPDSGCIGNSIVFTEKSTYATRRLWKFTGGTPSTSTDSIATVTYSKAGTYKVILTIENDNGVASDTTDAIVFPDPTANAGADKTFCPNSTVQIGAPPEAGNTYQWNPTTNLDNPTLANPTVTPTASAQYILTVTSNRGCIAYDTVNITPGTIKAVVTADTTICNGSALQLTASGGAQYKWTPATGLSNPAIENPIATPSTTTTYKVIVSSGSCIDSASVTVTVLPAPTAMAGQDRTICFGTNTTIGENPQAGVTYAWQPTAGLDDPTRADPHASPLATTSYILTVTAGNGCTAVDTVVVTIGNIKAIVTNDTSICKGSSVRLQASGGVKFQWTPPLGLDDPTIANPTASPSSTTTYKVVVSSGICSDTAFVTVTIPTLPPATAGADTILCAAGSVQLGAAPVSGMTYAWTPATGLDNPRISNPTATVGQSTTYILSVQNAMGCMNYDTVEVAIHAAVERSFTLQPDSIEILPSRNFIQTVRVPSGALTWSVRLVYDPFLLAFSSLGTVSNGMTAKVRKDARGELFIDGAGNSGDVQVEFKAYLPASYDTLFPARLVIDTADMVPCEVAVSKGNTLKLATFCGRGLRVVSASGKQYYMTAKDNTLDFGVGLTGNVRLEVFDYVGNSVLVVSDRILEAGEYSAMLDLPLGVYFCRMTAGMYQSVEKVLIAR